MQVILKETIEGKGAIGSIVRVARGYARNFLFPKGLAVAVNAANLAWLEEKKAEYALKNKEAMEKAQALAAQCTDIIVELKATVKENDSLYGSLGSGDVSDALRKMGLDIPRSLIHITGGNIKAIGQFTALCQLHETVAVTIAIHVAAE